LGLLRAIPLAKPLLDRKLDEDEQAPPVEASDRQKIRWGSEEAKAAYFAFSAEMDQWEEKDKKKFALGMRATENGERCATNVAAGCGSSTVDLQDIEWGLKWSRVSFEAADGGFKKYMRDYYEFPKFCDEVLEAIRNNGGFISDREMGRRFRRNMKFGNELEKALRQLTNEGRIRRGVRSRSRGPAANGWELVEEEAQ
jgi:hypothetical protein